MNFDYAAIVSPVDGVVVSRNVDVSQTVAASLSAPTLFLIAQDLTKVQIQASVPEADVGKLHDQQKVRFTVDAYTEKTFEGVVSQVRLASTTVSNVVTYTVIVDAENPEGLLFPGMTANAMFEVRRSEPESLKVPATALRLQPAKELLEAEPAGSTPEGEGGKTAGAEGGKTAGREGGRRGRPDGAGGGASRGRRRRRPGPAGPGGAAGARQEPRRRRRRVEPERRRPRRLEAAAEDLHLHEVGGQPPARDPCRRRDLGRRLHGRDPGRGRDARGGLEVVTAVLREDEPATTNPFAPPRMGGGGGGGAGRTEAGRTMPLIQVEDLSRIYHMGDVEVPALSGVSLSWRRASSSRSWARRDRGSRR